MCPTYDYSGTSATPLSLGLDICLTCATVLAMSNLSPDDLMPTSEVAETLGCTVKTIARWVSDGRLTPAAKAPGVRGAMFFRRSDVEDFARKASA